MVAFPAYKSYRDTDITWFSSVPSHWRTTRLKREAQIQTGVTLGKVYTGEVESRPYLRVANVQAGFLDLKRVKNIEVPRSEALKSELRPNDVVLTEGGDIDKLGRGAIWSGQIKGCIHQNHVFAVRPDPTALSPNFLTYILESPHGRSYFRLTAKQTTNLAATNRSTLSRFPLFLPPRPEQDQIVAYLRAQDAHIARFIKAKRELIKLLTEQKLRIIDHAVTRGLDASVAMKPSGIEWLGEVPEHWEVVHIGSAVQIVNGYPFDSGLFDAVVGHPLVRIRDLNRTHTEVQFNGPEVPEAVINTGDLIVGMDGDFNAARWRGGRALLNQRMCCLRPRKQITTEYLALVIPKALKFINDLTLSTTVKHLSSGDVKRLRFPIPGETEQLQIVAHVEAETAPINDAITRTEEEIKLIREYRDRLITDVVTGQVDVRGWQPGPDDAVSDDDLTALGDDEAEPAEEDGDGNE